MALPSSPPMLPELDLPEIELPDSPPSLPIAPFDIANGAFDRKRSRSEYSNLSSDPIFSDATTDADESEDSQRPKRKRIVRGPWWNVKKEKHDLRRTVAKKESLRNVDSGVWMGSDSSDGSNDSMASSQQRMRDLKVEERVLGPPRAKVTHKSVETEIFSGEEMASQTIQRCVEDGRETVDLSAMGLTTLSDETLRPLRHLLRKPFVDFRHPPSEDEFTPLTPNLKLFLSRNKLLSLPPELFNLTNISVLSLRGCELNHLPPSIARLHNLEELNIAGNDIRYLPWEFMQLYQGRQRHITVRPNPLVEPIDFGASQPIEAHDEIAHGDLLVNTPAACRQAYTNARQQLESAGQLTVRRDLDLRLALAHMLRKESLSRQPNPAAREYLLYLASSPVTYFGIDGTPHRRGNAPVSLQKDYSVKLEHDDQRCAEQPNSAGVLSFFETALRALQCQYNLPDVVAQLEDSELPPRTASAIRKAAQNAAGCGNEICSRCGRTFIIARAEWMEYWHHGSNARATMDPEICLPFLRKSCSWACARPSDLGEFIH